MFNNARYQPSGAQRIALGFVDLRAILLPCAVLGSFAASLVGFMLVVDAATRHLVI